jgi:hypothetical protein
MGANCVTQGIGEHALGIRHANPITIRTHAAAASRQCVE